MSASTSMKPQQQQPYQQDPRLDIEEMDDDFLFTHIPNTSLDFEDILNLAEPHSQALPFIPGHAQVDGKDPAAPFNLNSNNPNLHPYHTPVLDASTPSMTWSTSQSASSPESTFSLGTGGGTGNGSGFSVEGLGNVSSPSSLMQQQQQQVFLRQKQQQQQQQQLLFQQYQQQQLQQLQMSQPQFQQLQQQQEQSQGQVQAPSFNPDPFSLDGFGFDFSYEEPKYQSGNANDLRFGNTNLYTRSGQALGSGSGSGSGGNTGLNPGMNTGLVFDLGDLSNSAFPGSGRSQSHLYGRGESQGQQGQQGRASGSFEGTLGFGMGGPEITHNPNSNFNPNPNSNLNVNLDLGLVLDSARFDNDNSSGEVLSEQELKRLLSMGGGAGGIGIGAGNGDGDEFGFGAGFGGTVDWVGLLQGGGAGMMLQPDQPQDQPRERGEEGLAGGVKRESIDETGSTTSTAKGTASIVEAGELATSTTNTTDPAANAGPPPAPTSNPNRSPRQQQSKQPGINLHNKVEKRYRSNVKNALDSLRDSVPRLRQVYGTSLPSEIETTDKPDEDGLVGGVSEIGKPTKQTVMLGARMYIEYLEMKDHAGEAKRERSDRVLMRLLGTGPDSGDKWAKWEREQERVGKLAEEAYRQGLERKSVERALMLAPPGGSTSGGSPSSSSPPDGADEEEEEEAPPVRGRPKKRPRENEDDAEDKKPVKKRPATAKQPKKAGGKKATASVETVTGAGAAVMYSFGLAYTFFPRASSVFRSSARQGQVAEGSRSTGSVILSAPYRAANQSTHLLKRALPERHHDFWVLRPDDFLDWVGLFFLAGVLSWITWRLIKSFGLLTGDTPIEAEDEQAVEGQQVEVDILTESGYLGRIGTVIEGLKSLGSKFGRRHGDDEPAVERAWLRVTKAFVGKSLDLDVWTQTRIRWRMARKAGEDSQYAVLQALHTQDALHWQRARKLALDTGDKAIHDVVALPCSETRALSKRLGPSEDPVRSIAEYLVVTHLDDLATRLYISLVDASISSDVTAKNRLASLADVSYKEQIFEALHGVNKDSSAYSLGLVLIGLWGMLSQQDAGAQRSVANMLIASQLKDRVDLPSVDVFLRLVVPAYRPINRRDARNEVKPNRLSLGIEELDTLLEVCLRYVSLVKQLNSREPAALRGVYPETLLIRQLLGRPTFERTFKDISGYRMRTGSSSSDGSGSDTESIAGSEEGSISAIEAEVEAFDAQTDKLIDTLVEIGQRAASAMNA